MRNELNSTEREYMIKKKETRENLKSDRMQGQDNILCKNKKK